MKLFADAKLVSLSAAASVTLTSLRALLVLRLLGPELVGPWKAAMVLYLAGEFARLGVMRGMSMRIPILAGQGDEAEQQRLIRAAGFFAVVVGLVLGAAVLVYSFFVADARMRLALQIMTLVLLFAQPHQFLRDLASARHSFGSRAREVLIGSAVDFVSALALSYWLGLAGLGLATVLAIAVPVFFLRKREGWWPGGGFDWPRLREMARVGLPFSMLEGGADLLRYLDVLVMTPLAGATMVGRYSFSLLIMDFSVFVTRIGVSQVVAPHLLREYGREGSAARVAIYYEAPMRLFSYVLPPLLGAGSLLAPDFVRRFLPEYEAGIGAAQITMWSVFFMSLQASLGSFFLAADRYRRVLGCLAGLLPATAVAQAIVLRAGGGLTGAAWTTFGALGALTTAEIWIARRVAGESAVQAGAFLATLYLPLAAAMALTAMLASWSLPLILPMLAVTAVKAAVLLLGYTPVFRAYEARFSMLRMVRGAA